MAQKPLNQSIFRLVVGLVVLTTITIFASVWLATSEQTQSRLKRDLIIAENVLQRVLQNREDLLYNSAYVLTADFGFKQAVASGDKGTIDSALSNHGQRIKADLMALVSLDGQTVTSAPAVLKMQYPFPYPAVINNVIKKGGDTSLMMLDGQLYQVIMLTIDAPTPIGIALIGFKLDNSILTQLNKITQLETTLQVFTGQTEVYKISTLPEAAISTALVNINQRPSWLSITVTKDTPYISKQFTLADDLGSQTIITLSEDAQKLFTDFTSLQLGIIVICVFAILLATLLAALFSKKISQPLTVLAGIAERISVGNYTKDVAVASNTKEVRLLSEAFTSMQSNIQSREQEIIFQARHDPLTSLYNRLYIETLLDSKFLGKSSFLVVGINICGFRGINDVFGYHNGDLCLKELALRLSQFDGVTARLNGGELLWLPNIAPTEKLINALKSALEVPIDTGDVVINISVAMALIDCPKDANNTEEVFKRLNIVLDEAQITFGLVLNFNSKLEERYTRRLSIITELKNTLERTGDELSLNYQPKLDLKKGSVTHVEALIRWTNPRLGFVSPEDFIAIAEQAGLIENITSWVINRAIEDAVRFRQANLNVSVAINLSAKDIMNPALLTNVLALLKEKNLDTACLSFEITEGDLVKDHDMAIIHLQAFRDEGFEIAIDDFGTGYSSMAYLQNLPVNTLKVDKSFVLKLHEQDGDQKIVKTVINLAHSFDMNVVAEGVENIEALTLLADWGCELAQGYYICKPTCADKFITWYNDNLSTKWL
ncbi:MAG: diguanylate cyclase (GGDEF)-like protein [Paraglaciecola sp.]